MRPESLKFATLQGPSQLNRAYHDVMACVKALGNKTAAISYNSQGHTLITLSDSNRVVNLSLALRFANLEYYRAQEGDPLFLLLEDYSELKNATPASEPVSHLLMGERIAIARYTTEEYKIINAFLRGELTDKHQCAELKNLLAVALLIVSGLNKNRFIPSGDRNLEIKPNQSNSPELTRLSGILSSGMLHKLATEKALIPGAGINSFSQHEAGLPGDIRDNTLVRLKMLPYEQRDIKDISYLPRETEVAFPPTTFQVEGRKFVAHTDQISGEKRQVLEVKIHPVSGVATEVNDHYLCCAALAAAYEHLKKPYEKMPNYHHEGIWRPNHALAHHVRVAFYVGPVVNYFKAYARGKLKQFCIALSPTDIEKIKIFMAFSRSGRQSEDDFSSNPAAYRKELKNCASNLEAFFRSLFDDMSEGEIKKWRAVLEDMGNPGFEDNLGNNENFSEDEKRWIGHTHHIVNLAHKLDLSRCFSVEEYRHAVAPYRPNDLLISNKRKAIKGFDALEELAMRCIEATGDSFPESWKSFPHERPNSLFIKCNTSVLFCFDRCEQAAYLPFVEAEVSPLIGELEKLGDSSSDSLAVKIESNKSNKSNESRAFLLIPTLLILTKNTPKDLMPNKKVEPSPYLIARASSLFKKLKNNSAQSAVVPTNYLAV